MDKLNDWLQVLAKKVVIPPPYPAFQNTNVGVVNYQKGNFIASLDVNFIPKSTNPQMNGDLIKAQLQHVSNDLISIINNKIVIKNKIEIVVEERSLINSDTQAIVNIINGTK